jgi:hypothetical protein
MAATDRTHDAPDDDAGEALWASSMFGHHSRKGLVQVFIRGQEVVMTPAEARAFAVSVFEAADAAESDEFLMGFFADRVGIHEGQKLATILGEFREFRAAKLNGA